MQPVRSGGQVHRPCNSAIPDLALRDNLKTGNDFPLQRQCDSVAKFGPSGLPRPQHDRPIQETVRGPDRQGVKDDLERCRLRHVPVALTVYKFGLNPEFGSFGEKVHSARCLHATRRGVAKFSRCRKRIAVFNSLQSGPFHGNQCPSSGFVYRSKASLFPQTKRDVISKDVISKLVASP